MAAAHAVQSAGNTFGAVIAVVVFLTTFIAATIGLVAGANARGVSPAVAAGALARSVA